MSAAVTLVVLDREALLALAAGDLDGAAAITGLTFPAFFVSEAWLWRLHVERMREHPASVGWLARAVVLRATGEVVGHAGFHFQPDEAGMVEIGYTVLPEHRGSGIAKAVVGELLDFVTGRDDVSVVRASISPDNVASLAVVASWDFELAGEQIDEEDGLEFVYERQPPLVSHREY